MTPQTWPPKPWRRPAPWLAHLLLRILPADAREIIEGDLEELWRARPSRLLYWRMTLASLAAWIRHRLRGDGFGEHARESAADGDSLMQQLWQDLGYGLRLMRRTPGFTAAIVLTLAVGIGANAATFSMVNIMSLTPLSYRDPERVAFLFGWNTERQQRRFNMALADALDIGAASQSFAGVGGYQYWSANLTSAAEPERVQAYRVTANTFDLLGVSAAQGRALTPADGHADAPDVVVLSDGLWRRRFGASPSAIGQVVTLDGKPHTVVGVMPRRFEFPVWNYKGDAWTPLKFDTANPVREGSPYVVAIARLKAAVEYREAQAELDTVMRRLEADHPRTNRGLGARLLEMRRLGDEFGTDSISLVLLLAVTFVLLLACANVANLLLSRAVSREREIGVRAAIGAGRGRLVRQLLTESALLSVAGAVAGLALAAVMLRTLRGSLPELLVVTQPNVLEMGVDRLTLLYTAGLATLSALVFGAAPAWRTSRLDLLKSLRSGGQSSASPRHQRLRSTLMVAEVAMSVMLLVGAGLLVRGVGRLRHVDPGFNADSVLTMTISLPEYRYADADARRTFFTAALGNVQQIAGVRSVGFVNTLPLSTDDESTRYRVPGRAVEAGREPTAAYRAITPDYFATLQIPLVAGRAFDTRDAAASAQPVAIVNRTFARRTFGEIDPIGQQLTLARGSSTVPPRTIVGVVGDVLHSELTGRPDPEIYVPYMQAPGSTMSLAARIAGDPNRFVDPVRAALSKVDPNQPVFHIKSMQTMVDDALLPNRAATAIMSVFATLSLVLASVGIYGVMSYAVTQQTREFGVRLALGATPQDLLAIVINRGLKRVAIGTAIGGALAAGAGRALAAMLPSVRAGDVVPYLAVCAALLVVGAVACYMPARRAMRLDPVDVLRAD